MAGGPATSAGPSVLHESAPGTGTHAVPPSPSPHGDHSASRLAEQHAALFRLHRDTLARLPELSRLRGDANAAVTRAVEVAVRDLPPQDARRLELVRAASCFLDPAGPDSFENAKEALSRLAIGGLEGDTASSEQLDGAWAATRNVMPH